jgi:hypothetical protein
MVAAIPLGAASQDPSLPDDLPKALSGGLEGGPEPQGLPRITDVRLRRRFS